MSSSNQELYQATTVVLSCVLQGDPVVLKNAEDRKKVLEDIDEYPLTLIDIIGSNEEALDERHMASIFLKNYLYDFIMDKRITESLQKPSFIHKLSTGLIELLRIEYECIKLMVCKSLSYLVYKGAWTYIDEVVYQMLCSERRENIINGVFFLNELMKCDEVNMSLPIRIQPSHFQLILDIFRMKDLSAEIRILSVHPMFFSLMNCMELNENEEKYILTRLGTEFFYALSEPYSECSNFHLKYTIINYICKFEELGSSKHYHIITNSLPAIGPLLDFCCEKFKEVIKCTGILPKDLVEQGDEGSPNFMELVLRILTLILKMLDTCFEFLKQDVDKLLYYLIMFLSCYDNMESEIFLEDHKKTFSYPLRTLSIELVKELCFCIDKKLKKGPTTVVKSVFAVFDRLHSEVQEPKTNAALYYSRVMEAMMYAWGEICQTNVIAEPTESIVSPPYIDNLLNLDDSLSTLLIGRLLCVGGILTCHLKPSTFHTHIMKIKKLVYDEMSYLYVPCATGLSYHLKAYDMRLLNPVNQQTVDCNAKLIAECLITLTQKMDYPTLCLNALGKFSEIKGDVLVPYIPILQVSFLNIISTHLSDNIVMKELKKLFRLMIRFTATFEDCLYKAIVPLLFEIFHDNSIVPSIRAKKDAPEKALDLINCIVVYLSHPIDPTLVLQGFCSATKVILDLEQDYDSNMNKTALNFIITLLIKANNQILYLRNEKGNALVEFIPNLIFECIDSLIPIPGHQITTLCVVIFHYFEHVREQMYENILKSILSAVQTEANHEKNVGLWLVFIYIFMCRPANTMNLLLCVPGPNGGSALNFLISKFTNDDLYRISKFQMMVLAFCLPHVISFCLEGSDDKLKDVIVNVYCGGRNLKMSGTEYFYFLLITVLLIAEEQSREGSRPDQSWFLAIAEEYEDYIDENEFLLKYAPLSTINNTEVDQVIINYFMRQEPMYFQVCRKYLTYPEMMRLSRLGCPIPTISME